MEKKKSQAKNDSLKPFVEDKPKHSLDKSQNVSTVKKNEFSLPVSLAPSDSIDNYYEYTEEMVIDSFNQFLKYNFSRKNKEIVLKDIETIKSITNNIRSSYDDPKIYFKKFYIDIYYPLYSEFDKNLPIDIAEQSFEEAWSEMQKPHFGKENIDPVPKSLSGSIRNSLSFFFFFGQKTLHRMEINHKLASSLVNCQGLTSFDKMKDYLEKLGQKIGTVIESIQKDEHCRSIETHRGVSLGKYILKYLQMTDDFLFMTNDEYLLELSKQKAMTTKSNTRKHLIETRLINKDPSLDNNVFVTCSGLFYCLGKKTTKLFLEKKGVAPEALEFFDSFIFKTLITLFKDHNADKFKFIIPISWTKLTLRNECYAAEMSGLMDFDPTLMVNANVEVVESIMKSYYCFNPKFRLAPDHSQVNENHYYLPYHECLGNDERSIILRNCLKGDIMMVLPDDVQEKRIKKFVNSKTVSHYDQDLTMCFYRIIKCAVQFKDDTSKNQEGF